MFIKLHGKGDKSKRDRLIKRFELDPKKKARSYSKGNRQKFCLIAALSVDAELYIFDEPTSGLDPLMETIFQQEVNELKQAGKAILLSSHILSEVEHLATKIVVIKQGKVVESGSLADLRHLTRSTITLETSQPVSPLTSLTAVHDFKATTDSAAINEILVHATKLGIKKIDIVPPTLEDLFLRHYQ